MKPYVSITLATALEVASSPLSLLVMLAAMALEVFAPVFHYHQFGDPTRMARDAALSALLTCGAVFAVFGAIRAVRREIETGTQEMALAHAVARGGFFLAKAAGVAVAFAVFAAAVAGTAVTMFTGAAIGGAIAEETAQLARVYGPCVAAGVAAIVLPLALAAALNRFFRFRFVLTAFFIAAGVSVAGGAVSAALSGGDCLRLVPAVVLVACPALVLLSAAAAFAVRFRANAAAALSGVVLAAMLPAMDVYYRAESLSRGGSIPFGDVALAVAAALPAVAGFLIFGIHFSLNRE